jgi:pimeloyl-ACP methyl ester carboxylesterase
MNSPTQAEISVKLPSGITSHIVPGAGHWLPQEQPEKAAALMLRFLREPA